MRADLSVSTSQLNFRGDVGGVPRARHGIGRAAVLVGLDAELLRHQTRELHGRS